MELIKDTEDNSIKNQGRIQNDFNNILEEMMRTKSDLIGRQTNQ